MAKVLPVQSRDVAIARQGVLRRILPQPVLGGGIFAAALVVLGIGFATHPITSVGPSDLTILLVLATAIAASRQWPVRLGKATRLCVASVPLFLVSALFPPVLATIGVGAGMLTGELIICRRCGNSAGDIGAQVGRWMLLSYLVSALVHLPMLVNSIWAGALTGILLWAGDVLTCPVVFSPMTGKDPLTTVLLASRQSWPGEPMQYLIALLGLLLFRSDIAGAGAAWVDALAVLMVVLPIVLLYIYLSGEEEMRRATASFNADQSDI